MQISVHSRSEIRTEIQDFRGRWLLPS